MVPEANPRGADVAISMAGLGGAIADKRQNRAPILLLLAVALGAAVVSVVSNDVLLRLGAAIAALTMVVLVLGLWLQAFLARRRDGARLAQVVALIGNDAAP